MGMKLPMAAAGRLRRAPLDSAWMRLPYGTGGRLWLFACLMALAYVRCGGDVSPGGSPGEGGQGGHCAVVLDGSSTEDGPSPSNGAGAAPDAASCVPQDARPCMKRYDGTPVSTTGAWSAGKSVVVINGNGSVTVGTAGSPSTLTAPRFRSTWGPTKRRAGRRPSTR